MSSRDGEGEPPRGGNDPRSSVADTERLVVQEAIDFFEVVEHHFTGSSYLRWV
jgi:hypothetical protein